MTKRQEPKLSPKNVLNYVEKYKKKNPTLLPSISDIARGLSCTPANSSIAVKRYVDAGILKRVKVPYSAYERVDIA